MEFCFGYTTVGFDLRAIDLQDIAYLNNWIEFDVLSRGPARDPRIGVGQRGELVLFTCHLFQRSFPRSSRRTKSLS
jgi:hypothetical protein